MSDIKKQIDLGWLNRKQLDRIIDEIISSKIDIIGLQIFKVRKKASALLKFKNKKDRIQFDTQSSKLVKDLWDIYFDSESKGER